MLIFLISLMKQINTLKEYIYWSYANLGMAHAAIGMGDVKYKRIHFMIRAKMYKGFVSGSMSIASLVDDEKNKIKQGAYCSYCLSADNLSLDHLVPKFLGGENVAENIVCSCRNCNSSKGKRDLLEWYVVRNEFPPLMILRRYLKLAIRYIEDNDLADYPIADIKSLCTPFRFDLVPLEYPEPSVLRL